MVDADATSDKMESGNGTGPYGNDDDEKVSGHNSSDEESGHVTTDEKKWPEATDEEMMPRAATITTMAARLAAGVSGRIATVAPSSRRRPSSSTTIATSPALRRRGSLAVEAPPAPRRWHDWQRSLSKAERNWDGGCARERLMLQRRACATMEHEEKRKND
ncbi:unnamed protein product [Heligmosomoides polygyrus]|uniref:OSJNBa0016N04.16-like protein n=1 Tax=Heligmosomoides polygyrus TaxID=6339 RepID=A0A183FW82_HELPZ|nr:unnamed protein product [Heligmosomoides polygyrus]